MTPYNLLPMLFFNMFSSVKERMENECNGEQYGGLKGAAGNRIIHWDLGGGGVRPVKCERNQVYRGLAAKRSLARQEGVSQGHGSTRSVFRLASHTH